MTTHKYATITVSLLDREDGGLRVQSDDLPGLILSGPEKGAVIKSIVPAMGALLEHLGFKDFAIHPSRTVTDIMECENPQDLHMHFQQFVVEYAKAA